MASSVEIANRALSKLGAERITSLNDNTKGARAMLARFDLLRDAELEAHPWRFAIKLTTLPALSTAPAYGYARAFQRPSDDLRPISIGDYAIDSRAVGVQYAVQTGYSNARAPYEIVGDAIFTDYAAPLEYQYVRRVTNSGEFTALFVEALASRLAMDAAEELTQSASKQQAATQDYERALKEARRINALHRPPQRRVPGAFIQSRQGF